MSYLIKPLSPELAHVFTEYLSGLDFGHAPHWSTCYCRYYHSSCSFDQWQNRTGETNKAEALAEIEAGNMKGYLAFEGEKCIGWCNANKMSTFPRLYEVLAEGQDPEKTGCVICFVIHKDYRQKGIARKLLEAAVEGSKSQGLEAVLSLPVEQADDLEKRYRGTMNMYLEQGFSLVEKRDSVSLMQLKLK